MRSLVLVLALFVACISCFTEQEYRSRFTTWMQAQKKSYTAEEFQNRYAIFKNNMDYVAKWNAGNSQTVLGLTSLADLSNEEYRKTYLGTRAVRQPSVNIQETPVNAPDSVDWVTQGAVTPIKNQGQCGDCWAFSTTGSVEGIHYIATKVLNSLSEQNLLDCANQTWGNEGCNGGLMDDAFKYIIHNRGIDKESTYPYQGVQGRCRYNPDNSGATITGYQDVTSGSESALQTATAQQPVSVAIDASHESFQLYTSGVYYEPKCSTTQLDHGVLSVGYGADSQGTQYWLVKNSWGTSWGQAGYIWMSRNRNNNCGIATMASYPTGGGNPSTTGGSTNGNNNGGNNNGGNNNGGNNNNNGGNNNGGGSTYGAGMQAMFRAGGKGFKPKAEQAEKFEF